MIKAKKQAASDAEVGIKELDHEVQALAKEKACHITAAANLEKQYEWIAEESQDHQPPWIYLPTNARMSQQSVWASGIAV